MNKNIKLVYYLFLVLLFFIPPLFYISCSREESAGEEELTEVIPTHNNIFAFGTVVASEIYNIALDFPAKVDSLLVREGDRVKKGEVLLVLDMDEFKLQLEHKRTELEIARAELDKLLLNIDLVNNEIRHNQYIYDLTMAELEKQQILFEEGAVSKVELDDLQKVLDEKEMIINNLLVSLGKNRSESPEIKIQREKISLIQNEIKSMEQRMQKDYIEDGMIFSTFDHGVVFNIGVVAGDNVAPGEVLITLMDLQSLMIEAEVSEEFIEDIKVGDKAVITPLVNRNRIYRGTVTGITGRAFEKKGETVVSVLLITDNEDGLLLPGFNVDVEFTPN